MVQNFENLFKIPKNSEQQFAYFAQTASSLYSDNINGVIVLLTPSDWPKYAMGESANKSIKIIWYFIIICILFLIF